MVGLTLGKYAPLHKGHQWLIEQALKEVDHLIIIVYDAPKHTDIPLTVRANWIRTLYPDVEVIEADQVPKDIGYTEAIQKKHEDYIASLVSHVKIDRFYSSEPYGERMSLALGCENVVVDRERKTVQISGTEIRNNPEKYKMYMAPVVFETVMRYKQSL